MYEAVARGAEAGDLDEGDVDDDVEPEPVELASMEAMLSGLMSDDDDEEEEEDDEDDDDDDDEEDEEAVELGVMPSDVEATTAANMSEAFSLPMSCLLLKLVDCCCWCC